MTFVRKFDRKPDAEKISDLLRAKGHTVEWVKKNYGAQGRSTWNIRLSDGSEIHNTLQLEEIGIEYEFNDSNSGKDATLSPMAERTLAQVTKEIDQVAGEVTSLEAQIQAKRQKLTELVREQLNIQDQTLGRFGMRLVLENSRDSLPLDTPKRPRAPRGTATPQNPNAERNKSIRAWAADNNIQLKPKGTIPADVIERYNAANPTLV